MFGCTSQRGLGALRRTIAVVLMTLLAPVVAWAQQDAGTLRVLIQDAGGVVPGASVVVTNTATNVSVTQVSNDQGYAVFSPIPRGTYTVSATLQGFQPVRVSNVTIEVSQSRLLPVTLAVANVNETIEVTAQSAVIQTEDATLGQVLRSEVIETLPLAGRRYTDLALLTPGATESTADPNLRGPGWLVVNGNSHVMNNFLLDGFDNNQNTQNMQSRSAQVVSPSPDTLGEFKVITNGFSAEFGRAAGAVINASIKSGSNQYRGSAWIYNRDAALAANRWENGWRGIEKDDLEWNQPGATFGGPLRKDKLFFFGDYEGFFSKVTNAPFVTVPTHGAAQRRFQRTLGRDPRSAHGPAVPRQHHSLQPLRSAGQEDPRHGLPAAEQRLAGGRCRQPPDQQLHAAGPDHARHPQVGLAHGLQHLQPGPLLRPL